MEQIAEIAEEEGITEAPTIAEKIKKIYKYVNNRNNVSFATTSNIYYEYGSIDRSKWKTDWIAEAYFTIENRSGDCYSYYSLSKAFFEYFGIENKGVKRGTGYDGYKESHGTHFWSVVKIDDGSWYFYDATRLAGKFNDGTNNSCLITEKKLKSYIGSNGETYFYHMDPNTDLPEISDKELK